MPPPEPRHRSTTDRRRRSSSERGEVGVGVGVSAGGGTKTRAYLLEWSAQTCRQRNLLDADDLREEMGGPERAGWGRPSSTSRHHAPSPPPPPSRSPLELALWNSLGDDPRPLPSLIAELAYDAWLDVLSALPPSRDSVPVLTTLTTALENNADASRAIERRLPLSDNHHAVPSHDWTVLAKRVHRRTQLCISLSLRRQTTSQGTDDSSRDSNSRSLDRIAYLGGLLLPLTVVSGVLSIEGAYGPEGSSFWVFWLASGICSVMAVLVIYADHVRTLDVWMEVEVVAGDLLEGLSNEGTTTTHALRHHGRDRRGGGGRVVQGMVGDEERGEATMATGVMGVDGGEYVVQRRGDGTGGRAWRRRELGWAGAVKKMSGWYMWRGSPGMEFGRPGGWGERLTDLW